ncbi:MAG: SdiA-regulated domain-containing protein [Bacteroidota bacterium]|nr:SdiA-regulated domain-containing protein [Bacteroidota bacterium]
MFYRNLIIVLFFFAKVHAYQSCTPHKNKITLPSKEYDLNKPSIVKLNDALVEISGISFYPKDSSVFAISDENGYLYKIHLNKNILTERWKFDKKLDFEDVYLYDSTFYVLASNGNIHELKFSPAGDTIFSRKNIFPGADKQKNEFESLCYDDERKKIIMICKDCETDKKKSVTAWGFDPETGKYTFSLFRIDVAPIAKKLGEDKIKFKPSAATINPVTHDIWILSSINQLLVVTDRDGVYKDVYTLNPGIFTQPEGITFTPWGDLIISNEAGDKYNAGTLLIFKPKKTG